MSFPGMAGMAGLPGAVPGVPGGAPQQAGGAFVLDIPPDPTWQPFDQTDTLDKDGYYCFRIKSESATREGKAGVFLTLEIQDPDARGKILSKKLNDPRLTEKESFWVWRSLIRSIMGDLAQAQAGFRYTVGAFTNQIVYGKTGAYTDNKNTTRTGVDGFITKAEYDAAVAAGNHRWAPHLTGAGGGAGPVGALPGGLPASFPGMGSMGLPGGPGAPTGAPQPTAAAPMQQQAPAPSPIAIAATPGTAPQPAAVFAQPVQAPAGFPPAPIPFQAAPMAAPPVLPQTQAGPFAFPTPPGGAPPPGFPPPLGAAPTNGAPQPSSFPTFPGLPGATT